MIITRYHDPRPSLQDDYLRLSKDEEMLRITLSVLKPESL